MTQFPSEIVLGISHLTKRYGSMVAVDDLSFEVPKGKVLGIGGPNGAGKTTLFDLISGVTRASSGSVTFEGRDVSRLSAEQLCHLGVARTFQLNSVFDTMTVRENLTCSAYFGERNRVIPSFRFDKNARELAEHAIEATGLSEFADKPASGLPVLQRKLLMLASAIASKPRLLLLDEPVGGLNAREIEQCTKVFRRLRDDYGMTIVVIEHVMGFMKAIADTVMILHQGRKLYHGPTADLSGNAAVVEVYLGISGSTDLAAASNEKHL